MKRFLLYSVYFLLTGCSYRWSPDYPNQNKPTVFVPFIPSDPDGTLTSDIIIELSRSNLALIVNKNADLILELEIQKDDLKMIGYRIDPQKIDSDIKKNLLATEARDTLYVTAKFVDPNTDQIIYGPYQLFASTDFDYLDGDSLQDLTFRNTEDKLITVLPFSLGQLEPFESARAAAKKSLSQTIAKKLVEQLASEW